MSDESLRAISLDDFVHYRSAHAHVTEVAEAIDEVEALIGDGFPDAAIELSEFALDLLEEAITIVDDSDGGVGAMVRRAEGVHLAACQAGNPDRIALAERLATRALASDWEIFLTAIPDYANVLRDEADGRDDEAPPRHQPGTRGPNRPGTRRLSRCCSGKATSTPPGPPPTTEAAVTHCGCGSREREPRRIP